MPDIPTIEPLSLIKGETLLFTKSFPDYPATDGWTLSYAFRGASKQDVNATASGADFSISADTSTWVAGDYWYEGKVTKAGVIHVVSQGTFKLNPGLSTISTDTYDGRTDAKIIYDALIAAYKTFTASGGQVQEYEIAGRRMVYRRQQDFIKDIAFWKRQVDSEEIAEKVAKGLGTGRKLYSRFRDK